MEQYPLKLATAFAACLGFFIAILVLTKKQRTASDYLLAVINLLTFTIMLCAHSQLIGFLPAEKFPNIHIGLLSVTLPCYYIYVLSFRKPGVLNRRSTYLHFFPVAVGLIFLLFSPAAWQVDRALMILLYLLAFPCYLLVSIRELSKHKDYLLTRFSYTENIDLAWLNRMLWGAFVIWFAMVIFHIFPKTILELEQVTLFGAPIFVMFGFKLYLGIYGVKQPNLLLSYGMGAASVKVSNGSTYQQLSGEKAERIAGTINDVVLTQKLHLDPEINLAKLSEATAIPSYYISQVLNKKLNKNFYDFINAFRVEEFKQLALRPGSEKFSILALAYDAGFKSKSSFNAAFKKNTGCTPSQYLRQFKKV